MGREENSFYVVCRSEEKLSNLPPNLEDMKSFNDCLASCDLDDLKTTGLDYSWTNNQNAESSVWSRIDRILVNSCWLDTYSTSFAALLASGVSDHSPVLVTIFEDVKHTMRFSFLNC